MKDVKEILEKLYAIKDDDKFYFMSYGEDMLKALQPKRFNFKAEKGDPGLEKERGFIAQYEKDNFPEVYQLNGPDDDAKYGFHPMEMVPYLMKAVKDLVIKTEELERRIKTLES